MTLVLVTGASGFIAQNIVKQLISRGYKVVGTVRSSSKGDSLKKNAGENFKYEIVSDISKEGSFDEVLKKHPDIEIVLHTASPFFYDTTDPEHDLVIPAINGTKNILNAIKNYGSNVKRVVITSSDAAIYSSVDELNPSLSHDEKSWNNISYEEAIKEPVAAYYGAKSFAEKLAWKFYEEQKPGFKMSCVNPVYVFGPQAYESEVKDTLNVSNEIINQLTKLGPEEEFPLDKGGAVDVRDVALAHILAFERENTVGKRLLVTSGQFSSQMLLDAMNKNFPQLKGRIPLGKPGSGPEDIKALASVSNETTKTILGFEFTPLEVTVVDTVTQILNHRSNK